MKKYSLVPNAHNLMESTRSIGYSLPAAVADVIDNSIAAGASEIIVQSPSIYSNVLTILDNGKGMTQHELIDAMRYGSKNIDEERDPNDLGRFGLGLKMASLSQCRCLTVVTHCEKGNFFGARWDLDYIANSNEDWSLLLLDQEDLDKAPEIDKLRQLKSGTLVIWEKLDVMFMGISGDKAEKNITSRIFDLKEHLSLVFHRLLEQKNEDGCPTIKIEFNGKKLTPKDPFLTDKSTIPFEKDYFKLNNIKIWYQPYILPHPTKLSLEDKSKAGGDLQKDQGFYIYRNKRLIIWGTWFRLSRKKVLSKLARVMIDFPVSPILDKMWSLDVKKSTAIVPQELREPLKAVVERLGDRSEKVWTKRARVEQDTKQAFWIRKTYPDGNVSYEINKNNLIIQELIKNYPEFQSIIKLISSRLPLDSIYADLANEKNIEQEDEEVFIKKLQELGYSIKL